MEDNQWVGGEGTGNKCNGLQNKQGCQGTRIKDTWRRPKGVESSGDGCGGGEWWEKKGDNCT